jgi:uncharacterized protein YgiM (DUF1202 family)
MKKAKRTLISMTVFMTVFCITAIINIPFFSFAQKENLSDKDQAVTANSVTAAQESLDADLQSFSYQTNQITTGEEEQYLASGETQIFQAEATTGNDALIEDAPAATPDAISEATTEDTVDKESANAATGTEEEAPVLDEPAAKETKEPEGIYADLGISVAKSYVNIRKKASTDSSVLGKLYRGSAAEILDTKGDWYYVESGSVKGYVKSEFIKTGIPDDEIIKKYGVLSISVDVDGLNVRKEASTESKKLTTVYMNEVYPVVKSMDEWYEIKIPDENITGYVKNEFADLLVDFKKAVSKEEEQKLLQLEAEERAKKETEIKKQSGVSYSKEDLKLLACLIHSEAGTQSYEGKLAVANVVLNRVKSSKYPDTIKDVIYSPGQFSVATSGSLEKQLANYSNYSYNSQLLSIKAAKDALEGSNNIGTRLYFHSYKAAVKKGYDDKPNAVKIDDHLFW